MPSDPQPRRFFEGEQLTPRRMNQGVELAGGLKRQLETLSGNPKRIFETALLKILGPVPEINGYYRAAFIRGASAPSNNNPRGGDIDPADLGQADGLETAIVGNLAEISGGPPLPVGAVVLARFTTYNQTANSGIGTGVDDQLPVMVCTTVGGSIHAKVVCKGPCGEGDYKDNRYWGQLVVPAEGASTDAISWTPAPPLYLNCGGGKETVPNIVTFTNLGEDGSKTHNLVPGRVVQVDWAYDSAGNIHYTTPYGDEDTTGAEQCSSSSSQSQSHSHSQSQSHSKSAAPSTSHGGSHKSTAIVPASFHPSGYAALYVAEMPEVRFDDLLQVTIPQRNCSLPIDPRFVEVCAADTIVACGYSVDKPVAVGLLVKNGRVIVRFNRKAKRKINLVVRLSGLRKGFDGDRLRFESRTKEQFDRNEAFIRSAY